MLLYIIITPKQVAPYFSPGNSFLYVRISHRILYIFVCWTQWSQFPYISRLTIPPLVTTIVINKSKLSWWEVGTIVWVVGEPCTTCRLYGGGGGSHVPVSSFCDVFPWPCPSFLYQQKTGHCDVFSKHSEKLKDFSTTIGLKRIVDNDF